MDIRNDITAMLQTVEVTPKAKDWVSHHKEWLIALGAFAIVVLVAAVVL